MRKLTHRMWAKVIAMLLCIVGLLGSIVCAIGMVMCSELPSYREMLDLGYKEMADNYSAYLLDNMEDKTDEELSRWSDTHMRYAVIGSTEQELANVDLSDPSVYLYNNMDDPEDYDYSFMGTENAHYTYDVRSILGAYGKGYAVDTEDWETERIIRFVFAVDTGLFYCQTQSGYYPVNEVMIETAGGVTQYDLNQDGGQMFYEDETGERLKADTYPSWDFVWLDETGRIIVEKTAEDAANTEEAAANTEEAAANTEEAADTAYDEQYGAVYLLTDEEIPTKLPVVTGYEFEDMNFHYLPSKEDSMNYWVLSVVDETIVCDDLFSQMKSGVDLLYAFSSYVVPLQIAMLVLFLASFVFLMCAAGYRKEDEEVHLHFWDRIPFGIYTFGFIILEWLCGCIIVIVMSELIEYVAASVFFGIEMAVLASYLFLAYCMGIAARIKAKSFWRYTLLHYIALPIRKLCAAIRENVSLFWKTLLILIGIGLIEFLVIVITAYEPEVLISWFFAYKVVEFAVVIWAVLQMGRLQQGGKRIAEGDLSTPINTDGMFWEFKSHAENINKVGDGIGLAVEKQMKSERFKTELITNVSHDIKTPLTSIINYVDLIKKEEITDPTLVEYIDVLDRQSARLKKLIEDLMEASKASTGNLPVQLEPCDAAVFLTQAIGEFEERAEANNLELVVSRPEQPVMILADGRHLWRVFDNLLNNICKYAQPGTRVYISLDQQEWSAAVTFKNISKYPLNISSEELMERFVRGDSSRNTEGSGLGLSIAQSLTELMNGTMLLSVDGDLFKITLRFPVQ